MMSILWKKHLVPLVFGAVICFHLFSTPASAWESGAPGPIMIIDGMGVGTPADVRTRGSRYDLDFVDAGGFFTPIPLIFAGEGSTSISYRFLGGALAHFALRDHPSGSLFRIAGPAGHADPFDLNSIDPAFSMNPSVFLISSPTLLERDLGHNDVASVPLSASFLLSATGLIGPFASTWKRSSIR
jgi:hypothetical protein